MAFRSITNLGAGQATLRSQSGLPGTSGGVSGQLFGGDLGAVAGAYGAASSPFSPGGNAAQSMAGSLANYATSSNVSYGTGAASALLKGHDISNAAAGGNNTYAPITHAASTWEPTDGPITKARFLAADQTYKIPGDGEIACIKKPIPTANRAYLSTNPQQQNDWAAGGMGTRTENDMNALIGLHPFALNDYGTAKQLTLFKTDIVRYQQLTPSQYIQGCELPWTGWTIDGGGRLEEMGVNPASTDNDGYGGYTPFNVVSSTKRASYPQKVVTMTRAGRCRLKDIWQSRGLRPGARLYLVCTKRKWRSSNVMFTLTTKAGTLSEGVNVTSIHKIPTVEETHNYAVPALSQEARDLYNAVKDPFMGFQLFALAVEDGGSVPKEFTSYVDEWGVPHYDGIALCLGTQLHPQFGGKLQPPITRGDDPAFVPLVDGTQAMIRPLIPDVLLNPYKDGVFSLM